MFSVGDKAHRSRLRDDETADFLETVDQFAKEFDIEPAEAFEQLRRIIERQIIAIQMRKGTYSPE